MAKTKRRLHLSRKSNKDRSRKSHKQFGGAPGFLVANITMGAIQRLIDAIPRATDVIVSLSTSGLFVVYTSMALWHLMGGDFQARRERAERNRAYNAWSSAFSAEDTHWRNGQTGGEVGDGSFIIKGVKKLDPNSELSKIDKEDMKSFLNKLKDNVAEFGDGNYEIKFIN
jgi:hypothetical protein